MKHLCISIILTVSTGMEVFACDDISGAYLHHWEKSDFREGYCLDVKQISCNKVSIRPSGVLFRNGKFDKNEKSMFPEYEIEISKAPWLLNGWFERNPSLPCNALGY